MLNTLRKGITLLLVLMTLALLQLQAQNNISSPYSGYGVGLLDNVTSAPLAAMGHVSYAMQHNTGYINFRNPASYAAFDSLSFIADAAFSIISSTLKTDELSQKTTYARPGYLTIGLPVTKHWRTSAGILPFSKLGYAILDKQEVDNIGKVEYTYKGDGGLMQLYWGNAFKLCKGLSIGLNVSYIWGRLSSIRTIAFSGENYANSLIDNYIHVDGIHLSAGAQYFVNIKENHRLGLGAVYENTAYIWAKENSLVLNYEGEATASTSYDTVANIIGNKGNMRIPQSVGGGLSYSFKNKILVAADVTWQNWSKYSLMGQKDSLQDAINVSVGVQYTPNPTSSKVYKRLNIRAGARYSTGYIRIKDTPISEFSVALGLGIPLKTATSQSSINIMMEYGQMGTLANDLIKENFFRLTFNFVLHEKWYQRVKLE